MYTRMSRILVLSVVLMAAMTALPADAQSQSAPTAKVEKVALFKNGLGFFTSSMTLPNDLTQIELTGLPVPVLGTFWVAGDAEVKIRNVVSSVAEHKETVPVRSIGELLKENAGQTVVLYVLLAGFPAADAAQPRTETITGTLLTQAEFAPPLQPNPYVMEATPTNPPREGYPYPYPINVTAVMLQTDAGIRIVRPESLANIRRADNQPLTQTATKTTSVPRAVVTLDAPAAGKKVYLTALAKGITWVPSYLVDISDPATATFTAKAQIINEVTDLDAVDIELVTGYPNIQLENVLSPIAMKQSLADFLRSLSTGRTENGDRNMMMNQMAQAYYRSGSPSPAMPDYSAQAAAGEATEDLFFYPVKSFSLKKKETAFVPLFTVQTPYRHIYTWKVNDAPSPKKQGGYDPYGPGMGGPGGRDGNKPAEEEVWHCCRLKNTLDMPLTTATAEFVSQGRFVGQDICLYTPANTETTIRINRAMNVAAEQLEYELDRKRNAAQFYGRSHDWIRLCGQLQLTNRTASAITVEITKEVTGEVAEMTPEGQKDKLAKRIKEVTPTTTMTWTIEMKPGEETTLKYVYETYVCN